VILEWRRSFGVVDDIFCIFEGFLDNVAVLRQRYGLNKTANEVAIVIEAYRTLRDRGPYPADQVVRDFSGKFAFVLYDSTSQALFTAVVRLSFSSLHFLFFVLDFPLKYLRQTFHVFHC
jgi:asparagine synthetase B (glutamine-hydrolysing)